MIHTAPCPQCGYVAPLRPLTRRQREVYDFLASYGATHGFAPTLQEIADAFGGLAISTVSEHITNLARKGWLAKDGYNHWRALALHGVSEAR